MGRDALLHSFDVTVGRAMAGKPGQSIMPIGLRGVGKTVLLNRFVEQAEAHGLQVSFIEAPESGDLATLLAARLRKVLLRTSARSTASVGVRRAGMSSVAAAVPQAPARLCGLLAVRLHCLPKTDLIRLGRRIGPAA